MLDAILAIAETTVESTRFVPPHSPISTLPFMIGPCIMIAVGLVFYGFIVYAIIQMLRYFSNSTKERQLLRMELSKLSEEVHLMRKQSEKVDVEKETDDA